MGDLVFAKIFFFFNSLTKMQTRKKNCMRKKKTNQTKIKDDQIK